MLLHTASICKTLDEPIHLFLPCLARCNLCILHVFADFNLSLSRSINPEKDFIDTIILLKRNHRSKIAGQWWPLCCERRQPSSSVSSCLHPCIHLRPRPHPFICLCPHPCPFINLRPRPHTCPHFDPRPQHHPLPQIA